MADVFISSGPSDPTWARQAAQRLESFGFSVSVATRGDNALNEINTARAVIIVWSGDARNSVQLCAQAALAVDAGKLLQVRLDGAPPAPFDAYPCLSMSGERAEWGPLEAQIVALVKGEAEHGVKPPRVGWLGTASAAGAPRLLTIALATSLPAYFGALTEAAHGVMSPDQLQLALTGVIGVAGASAALCAHRLISIARADA